MNDIKQHKYYYRSWQKIIDDQLCYNEQYKSKGEFMKCIEWTGSRLANQQATANHTAKMFNQSRTTRPKQRIENSEYAEIIALEPKYEWKKDKEIKMTRKEAIEKVVYAGYGTITIDGFVRSLEALGLIKFDEEKSVVDEAKEYVRNYTLYDRQELAGVIDMLIRHIEK